MREPLPPLSHRVNDISSFLVMDLLTRAKDLEESGRRIIHLEIGEPDFETPAAVVEAGCRALRAGATRYTPALGLPELREAIARFYRDHYRVEVPSDRIVITPGASGALQLVMGVLVNPGSDVLVTDPGYPCNRNFVRLFEGRTHQVPVSSETHYLLTPELLRANWTRDTVAALIATPSNPTGTTIPQAMLADLVKEVADRQGALVVDEIYQGLVYEGSDSTALSLSDQVFVINSFSKFFGMTGWRLGWVVAPESYIRSLEKLAQNLFLCAPTVAQYAALAAFEPDVLDILESRRRAFRERRNYLVPALRKLGFDIPVTPEGAFYVYAGCSRFTKDSQVFCGRLLEEAGVAVTPGFDFGSRNAALHVRFAYTAGLETLREGISRLEQFLGNNPYTG